MSLSEIRSFDYAVLLCSRMEETRAFYRDVTGFAVETDRGTLVIDHGAKPLGGALSGSCAEHC